MDIYNEEDAVAQFNEQASEEGVARATVEPIVVLISEEDIKKLRMMNSKRAQEEKVFGEG